MNKQLMKEYEEWVAKLLAKDIKMTVYKCPTCEKQLHARIPEKGVYDSIVGCPYCEGLHFKVVATNGKVKVKVN